jgi:hypothetical protein
MGASATRTREARRGGVISPLLANIYLHEVLDTWFEREVKPRLSGRATLVRYADDAVLVFGREQDALKVMAVLPKRFGKYGLTLHPEKTRLVEFRRPDLREAATRSCESWFFALRATSKVQIAGAIHGLDHVFFEDFRIKLAG